MSTTVTTSQAYATLKATLEKIVTDDSDGYEKKAVYKQYMKIETMKDNYVDELSNGGPGVATEKAEGQALDVMGLNNGYQTRYQSRKHGLIMQITEELDDDGKYNSDYIDAARRMKRAVFKAMEIDNAQILNRVHNSDYAGGDGVALGSSSHTIPGGGTFSNTLATAFSPSRAALIVVRQNLMVMPGWDGVTEGYLPTKVVCPPAQWGAWSGILGSEKVPESGNNEINLAADMGLGKVVAVPYWTGSTTNWLVLTDAAQLKCKVRKAPKARTWYSEETEIINHGISARWARGYSDPRAVYTSNA